MLLVPHFQKGRTVRYGLLLRLAGMLVAASVVVPIGLLSMRPLQVWINGLHLDPKWHKNRRIKVSPQCLLALQPWRNRSYFTQGVPMGLIPSHREVIVTDASRLGWGVVWQHRAVRGAWSPHERKDHINVLKLQAVQLALKHFLPFLKHRHLLVTTKHFGCITQTTRGAHDPGGCCRFLSISCHGPSLTLHTSVQCILQEYKTRWQTPSTLKVYVAGISSHHATIGNQTTGSHSLVIHFLKGEEQERPLQSL